MRSGCGVITMPSIQLPIVRGDKTTAQTDYGDRLPKNMIAVSKEIRGAAGYLISADGLKSFGAGLGLDRGGYYSDRQGKHCRVSGGRFITVGTDGAVTNVGAISGAGQASFAQSFNSLCVVTDGKAWRYVGGSLVQITDPDLKAPIDVCWIDGYFFFTDGQYIYHTQPNNEALIDPLDYATAEFMPDKSLGVMQTQDNFVLVFGRYSMEYFVNQANVDFAFSRIAQKSIQAGIVGTHCKCMLSGMVFILGGRKDETASFHVVQAGGIENLSTQTVDEIFSSYTEAELSTAVLESRTDERDQLVIVRLPRHTLMYNHKAAMTIGKQNAWSVLSYGVSNDVWLGANGVFDPRIAKWVYGSVYDGGIYTLDKTSAALNGTAVECEFSTPLVPAKNVRVGDIELNTIAGYNKSDVVLFMSVSFEGAFVSSEMIQVYSGPLQYGRPLLIRRAVAYVSHEFSLQFRCVSKDKINVSNLVVNYG